MEGVALEVNLLNRGQTQCYGLCGHVHDHISDVTHLFIEGYKHSMDIRPIASFLLTSHIRLVQMTIIKHNYYKFHLLEY